MSNSTGAEGLRAWPSAELREVYHALWHLMDSSCEIMAYKGVERVEVEPADYKDAATALALFEQRNPALEHGEEGWDVVDELHGPDGFPTWKDAAVAERVQRVEAEQTIAQQRQEIEALRRERQEQLDILFNIGPITCSNGKQHEPLDGCIYCELDGPNRDR